MAQKRRHRTTFAGVVAQSRAESQPIHEVAPGVPSPPDPLDVGAVGAADRTWWLASKQPLPYRTARRLIRTAHTVMLGYFSYLPHVVPAEEREALAERLAGRYEGPGGSTRDWEPTDTVTYSGYRFTDQAGATLLYLETFC